MDGLDALSGLHGERGDGGDAVAIVGGERLQIGADACAAGRIESGDSQKNWWSVVRVIVQLSVPPREAIDLRQLRRRRPAFFGHAG